MVNQELLKTILITGIGGFIGSNVAKKFLNKGFKVIGIDDLSSGKKENIPDEVTFIQGDLVDSKTLDRINTYCEYILHIAGQSSGEVSFEDPVLDLQKNTQSTLNLIRFGIKNKSKKIIYASSMSIYGDSKNLSVTEEDFPSPKSCYGVSKLASEKYLDIFSNLLPYVSMRMFNVYGPGQDLDNLKQGMVSIYISQAFKNNKILVKGNLDRFRDFIFIDDVVEAWYKVTLKESIKNEKINIGTGKKVHVKELLEIIISKFPKSYYFVHGSTPGDQKGVFANNKKLKKLTGINKFTSLENGIEQFCKFLNKNY